MKTRLRGSFRPSTGAGNRYRRAIKAGRFRTFRRGITSHRAATVFSRREDSNRDRRAAGDECITSLCRREGVAERSADGYRNYNSRMQPPPVIIPGFTLTIAPPEYTLDCVESIKRPPIRIFAGVRGNLSERSSRDRGSNGAALGTTRTLLRLAVAAILFLPPVVSAQNIVIVVIDDAGIERFGTYAIDHQLPGAAPTPTIDSLASTGVRFDNFWAYPVCSPFRASLLTGVGPWSHGVGTVINPSIRVPDRAHFHVPDWESEG